MTATIASSATTASSANATAHTINLPTGIVAGSRLLMILCVDSDATVTYTGGIAWQEVVDVAPSVAVRVIFAYYDCDGSEGASTPAQTSTSQGIAAVVVRLAGHHADPPEAAYASAGGGLSVDPPSLAPTWGAEDTLFGVALGYDVGTNTISAWPTGFDTDQLSTRWNNSGGTGVGLAFDAQTAASVDPSQFSISPVNAMKVGVTFAVRTAVVAELGLVEVRLGGLAASPPLGLGAADLVGLAPVAPLALADAESRALALAPPLALQRGRIAGLPFPGDVPPLGLVEVRLGGLAASPPLGLAGVELATLAAVRPLALQRAAGRGLSPAPPLGLGRARIESLPFALAAGPPSLTWRAATNRLHWRASKNRLHWRTP